jgi:hypothetical protein
MAQMQDKRSPSTVTRDTGCNKCEHPYIPSVKKGAQADHQAGEVEQSLSSRSSPKSSASPSKCLMVRMPLTGRSTSMRASIRPSSLVVRNDPSSPDWLLTIREHIQRQRQLESSLSSHISVKCCIALLWFSCLWWAFFHIEELDPHRKITPSRHRIKRVFSLQCSVFFLSPKWRPSTGNSVTRPHLLYETK